MHTLDIIFWTIALGLLLLLILRQRRRHRRSRLLRKVSGPDRGTRLERELVISLLEHGVKPATIFHDLYVDMGRDRYSQTDIVVLIPQGIIAIEVKDYAGAIFGKGDDAEWIKSLAYGKEKHSFYNPVRQNEGHIRALRNALQRTAPEAAYFSVIVFSGRATLHRIDRLPADTYVCYDSQLPGVIKEIARTHRKCRYADKEGVARTLARAVGNGAYPEVVERHARNIAALHPDDRR